VGKGHHLRGDNPPKGERKQDTKVKKSEISRARQGPWKGLSGVKKSISLTSEK